MKSEPTSSQLAKAIRDACNEWFCKEPKKRNGDFGFIWELRSAMERLVGHRSSDYSPTCGGTLQKARGLYEKFSVVRNDGKSEPGKKHHGCRYFVLDLDHDPHARPAMQAYAHSCQHTHPKLGDDIVSELAGEETEWLKGQPRLGIAQVEPEAPWPKRSVAHPAPGVAGTLSLQGSVQQPEVEDCVCGSSPLRLVLTEPAGKSMRLHCPDCERSGPWSEDGLEAVCNWNAEMRAIKAAKP